jgi:outer membrane protein OmpA-like peptidoglycan-associated protein
MLSFAVGCSLPSKHHRVPEITIVSDGDDGDIFYLQKPLRAIGSDPLQTAYNYEKSDIVTSIFFDFNSAKIKEEAVANIDAASKFFTNHPELKALVVGHCDHFGAANYNNFLGHRRAESARAKLIEFGLDDAGIITASVGSEQAYERSADKSATIVDRRADIVLFKPMPVTPAPSESGEQNDGDIAED